MKFLGYRFFFADSYKLVNGVSLGIHVDWKRWRFDVHLLNWTFSFGRVPIWNHAEWGDLAASGSWHDRNVDTVQEEYLYPRGH